MYVKVRVSAGAKRESFKKLSEDCFTISVKEKAEANQANKRVVALLSAHFRVPEKSIRLVSGHHAPSKRFSVPER